MTDRVGEIIDGRTSVGEKERIGERVGGLDGWIDSEEVWTRRQRKEDREWRKINALHRYRSVILSW